MLNHIRTYGIENTSVIVCSGLQSVAPQPPEPATMPNPLLRHFIESKLAQEEGERVIEAQMAELTARFAPIRTSEERIDETAYVDYVRRLRG